MAPRWSADVNIKFVRLYRLHECLWDQFNPLYTNRLARENSLAMIACEMDIEGFGSDDVNRKIKALRATYHSEMSKQESSKKSGCGPHSVYTPTLKWLKDMKHVMTMGTLKRKTKNVTLKRQHDWMESKTGETDEEEYSLTEQGGDEDPLQLQPQLFTANNTIDAKDSMLDEEPLQTQSFAATNTNATNDSISDEDTPQTRPFAAISTTTTKDPDDLLLQKPQSCTAIISLGRSVPIKRFKTRSKAQQMTSPAREENKQLGQSVWTPVIQENEFDIFGKHVASQLKQLKVEHAVTAIGEINNILMEKRLASLVGQTNPNDCRPSSSSSNS